MGIANWERLEELFDAARRLDPPAREAFLVVACGGDETLLEELRSLLRAHDDAGSFIEPAVTAVEARPSGPVGGEPSEPPEGLRPGTRLGPYEIVAGLGKGGMGEVYRARDTRLGREVAVKVLPSALLSNPDRLRRFEEEARRASSLNHPNILTVHDVGTVDSTPYITMELVDGKTLRELFGSYPLPPKELLSIAAQLAAGLANAHDAGIVHRDLKPQNVMVTPEGVVKILDFGLAKYVPREAGPADATTPQHTRPGTVMGTVGYMSPEQAAGRAMDFRSDQFSLGAILYELATGRRAFQRPSDAETLAAILRDDPRPIGQSNPHAPAGLQRILERCLAKDPKDRYTSTRDLLREIERVRDLGREERHLWPVSGRRRTPIAIAAVVVLAAAVGLLSRPWWPRLSHLGGGDSVRSLMVLPLANVSGDPAQDYLSEGVTDALIADLGKIATLRVISRTTAMSYRRSGKTVPQIGRELGVDAVVEGSVLRAGNRVRVDAHLIEAATDRHLWSETYEGSLRDVLSLQRDVVRSVAGGLRAKLTPQDQTRLGPVRAVDTDVYEAYLKGRYYWNKRTEDSLRKAVTYFQAAIRGDPTYAPAYAALADSYNQLGTVMVGTDPPTVMRPLAAAAAIQALQIDPDLAEAHAALGFVKHYEWDWEGAEKELRHAIELNPSYALAHICYANFLMSRKRVDESVAEVLKAEELDPLSPTILTNVGWMLAWGGRPREGMARYEKAIVLDAGYVQAHWRLGGLHRTQGHFAKAIAEQQAALALAPRNPSALAELASIYALAGRRPEAEKLLAEMRGLASQRYVSPAAFGWVYTALGDHDRAFEWLDKASQERSNFLVYLLVDPRVASLRPDPRFRALAQRVGLPL
jgi:serine/threonine protein kinase/TolB-like protein/Tfp pilus assembly protein PilF